MPAAARTTAARTRSRAAIDVATLARTVAAELQRHGDGTPDDVVVATLARVAAGYRKGPGASPPWPMAIDLDARVAEGLVDVYWTGDRLPDPDRRELRATARTWASYNMAQLGTGGSAKARNTLAAVGLGAWRPGEPKTKVKPLVDMVAGWYLAGSS